MKLQVKCGCGKDHLITNKRQFIKVFEQEWLLSCFIKAVSHDVLAANQRAAKAECLLSLVKQCYPEFDMAVIEEALKEKLYEESHPKSTK